jgi:hypothetical protein
MSVTDALRQDVKSALRGLWKSPGFAVAVLGYGVWDAQFLGRSHAHLE